VGGCGLGCALTGIALIDIGNVDGVASDGLDGAGKPFHLAAIFGTGGRYMEREQMAQRIDRHVDLGALLALAAVVTARSPLSGVERSVRLSMMCKRVEQAALR
jgi:hypothetical protein